MNGLESFTSIWNIQFKVLRFQWQSTATNQKLKRFYNSRLNAKDVSIINLSLFAVLDSIILFLLVQDARLFNVVV